VDIIKVQNLTKDYGDGCGIFDVDFSVKEGEVFGLVGINSAGKTTLIRHLMGFIRPQSGKCSIMGKDCTRYSAELKKYIGYIPGEISFPDVKSGNDFFELQSDFRGNRGSERVKNLCKHFNLDASARLKRMSKGMKQKSAIVNAFMSDSKVLILDEGTTGLEPLMQKAFIDLILEEKSKGKTVFMSSHMFDELESTCDHVAFLKNGRIIDIVKISEICGNERIKKYNIGFVNTDDYDAFIKKKFNIVRKQNKLNQVTIDISDEDINSLFAVLSEFEIKFITQIPQTLENYFKEKYTNMEDE
jgi:ABC-2 type transport system ATP-binding protein